MKITKGHNQTKCIQIVVFDFDFYSPGKFSRWQTDGIFLIFPK